MKPIVQIPQSLIDKCIDHGKRIVATYRNGGNAASLAVSSHGAQHNPHLQATGKIAECAFFLWMGVDPLLFVNWTDHCDRGCDARFHGVRFDIKTTTMRGQYLIWPINKNGFYESKGFDALALIKLDLCTAELTGWVSKARFLAEHQVADEAHKLDCGTWYMHERELSRFDDLQLWRRP
jgi:hypothetical protein